MPAAADFFATTLFETAILKSQISNLKSVGWAVFLGCSWTWCIGMFLPVIFIRHLGIWGWIVFAVPNVIGAAGMGWVLRKPGQSEQIVHDHAAACSAFSAVTLAFHIFFLLWFVPRLVGLPIAACALALAALYLLITMMRQHWDLPAAAIVWIFSIAMLILFVCRSGRINIFLTSSEPAINAIWLAPVCIFGFFLNPYLDLTFHRARQALNATEARVAFGLGFGLFFFSMIVFTLLYAATISPLLAEDWAEHLRPALASIIAAQMIVQAAFTISVHARSFVLANPKRGIVFAFLILAQGALFLALASNLLPRIRGIDAGELIYLLFMALYAVIFPAYVWLCMIPGRDGVTGPTTAKVRVLLLCVIVVIPMFWMAFIETKWPWLAPGLAVILLSRFIIPRRLQGTMPVTDTERATHVCQ